MIKRIYSKIIEILYTICLSRKMEKLILQGHDPIEVIHLLTKHKLGNKYVTQGQAEQAIENLKRYVRPIPTPTL
jgi:hypothetical protein